MSALPLFEEPQLRALCDILGHTEHGLKGHEIGELLRACGIDDPEPSNTKRHRLFEALRARQEQDQCGNNVAAFIQTVMSPFRFHKNPERFGDLQEQLNYVLAFAGFVLTDDGQLHQRPVARSLSEAQNRAVRLRRMLQDRGVHPDVLRFCQAELLQDNYFHAVFEATKSVADKIRQQTGLTKDGSPLVDEAFGLGQSGIPLLAFNTLQTETERSEHTGLMNLLKGLFGTFRNTTAHAPRIKWVISEQDALDMLSLTSLLHRRLDAAIRTP
ncbi:MAG: TIGR02391 family protein [Chloroflexaceae bacterium]|nr:TIGR02391 family protein [Chloroflexaceae bacterium]